jgi:putative membrane protein
MVARARDPARQAPAAHEHEASLQESLERSAAVSGIIFNAPPTPATYAFVILASAFFGLFLDASLAGAWQGFLILGVPALIAGPLSAPVAILLGGTLYYKRSAFLAAVGVTVVGGILVLSVPVRFIWDFPVSYALLFGYMLLTAVRHAVLYATSDNRHSRTLPVTLLQTGVALPFIATTYGFGADDFILTALLPVVFLAPLILFLHIFDAPLQKNFNVSASELFRYYLDHLTSGRMDGEEILSRFAEPIQARYAVTGFRRLDGTVKAAVVVPALHPGPVGRLGGSDLPGKVREALPEAGVVMVPHGAATHDYNPVSTTDVERFGHAVLDLLESLPYATGGTRAARAGEGVEVTAQAFGTGVILSYTSWPEPIDDVDYGVGLAAELSAELAGAEHAVFIDCHNSLVPGSGAVFLCTPRADAIIATAKEATRRAFESRVDELRVGVAEDNSTFSKKDGIGDQGVQVLVVDADGERNAYVLWDGNNAVPEVTRLIRENVEDLVDSVQVMTTDNHSVNAVAGAYGPVGHLADPARVADVTRDVVEAAVNDLEPVETAFGTGTLDDLRVYGNQKTVQLTSAINVMTSILPELVIATVIMQILASILLFYLVGIL